MRVRPGLCHPGQRRRQGLGNGLEGGLPGTISPRRRVRLDVELIGVRRHTSHGAGGAGSPRCAGGAGRAGNARRTSGARGAGGTHGASAPSRRTRGTGGTGGASGAGRSGPTRRTRRAGKSRRAGGTRGAGGPRRAGAGAPPPARRTAVPPRSIAWIPTHTTKPPLCTLVHSTAAAPRSSSLLFSASCPMDTQATAAHRGRRRHLAFLSSGATSKWSG